MSEIHEMNMLISGILNKNGEKTVCVYFSDGPMYAEGYVPQCKITSQKGFTEEEISKLEAYLSENKEDIFARAKSVNPIKAMMQD